MRWPGGALATGDGVECEASASAARSRPCEEKPPVSERQTAGNSTVNNLVCSLAVLFGLLGLFFTRNRLCFVLGSLAPRVLEATVRDTWLRRQPSPFPFLLVDYCLPPTQTPPTQDATHNAVMAPASTSEASYRKDEKVFCFHHELLYEAKVTDVKPLDEDDKKSGYQYKVHYKGWKNTYVYFSIFSAYLSCVELAVTNVTLAPRSHPRRGITVVCSTCNAFQHVQIIIAVFD